VVLNGDPSARYWGNVNLSFAYVEGESLLMGLKVGLGQLPRSCPGRGCRGSRQQAGRGGACPGRTVCTHTRTPRERSHQWSPEAGL
jgi:hypothetical protein